MTNKNELIVFMGLKECGKNYNAQKYINRGYTKIDLADSLRDMLWDILGWKPNKECNYSQFKKSVLTTEVPDKFFLFNWYKDITITTGRKLLQNLGSAVKKLFGETIWAKIWYEKVLQNSGNTVCCDCRFTYEVKKALSLTRKGYTVKFIWCCYKNANFKEILQDKHESEALNQFIYYNREKYGLKDGYTIPHTLISHILEDFTKDSM